VLDLEHGKQFSAQSADADLAATFKPIAESLTANESKIVAELLAVQGNPVEVGGYYKPDNAKADAALRPSATLNGILAGV